MSEDLVHGFRPTALLGAALLLAAAPAWWGSHAPSAFGRRGSRHSTFHLHLGRPFGRKAVLACVPS